MKKRDEHLLMSPNFLPRQWVVAHLLRKNTNGAARCPTDIEVSIRLLDKLGSGKRVRLDVQTWDSLVYS